MTELRLGVNKQYDSGTEAHREAVEALDRLCARFEVLDVTRTTATAAAGIIADVHHRGLAVNDLHDVYIAATAKTEQLPVLTANVDHFDRMPDLQVVDWTSF